MKKLRMQLRGGLGNQLFQAVAISHFSSKLSATALLDDVAIIRHRNPSRRSWLRKLDIGEFFSNPNLRWTPQITTKIRSSLPKFRNTTPTIDEFGLTSIRSLEKNFRVVGWFQSNEYLPKKHLVLNRRVIDGLPESILEFGDEIIESKRAAIHIRLGDFKQTSWGVLPSSWYGKAIEKLWEIGVSQVDCFSDDIEDAKAMLNKFCFGMEFNFPEEKRAMNPVELLWVLSSYKYFASSNSSLSWWASYLNRNDDKIIYFPWNENLIMENWLSEQNQ
jgi:hypothetical protein